MLNKNRYIKEVLAIGILFVSLCILFEIIFYKTDISRNIYLVASLFYIFILPGYSITLFLKDDYALGERIVIGSLFSAAILGILTYDFGVLGWHIKSQSWILPPIFIMIGVGVNMIKFKQKQKKDVK